MEYKKTLEQNLININYLYNGDILSSIEDDYIEIKKTPLTSPSFIINSIIKIYNDSFNTMMSRSNDITIPIESIISTNIFDKISELGIKPLYIFCSHKSKKYFGLEKVKSNASALPYYFFSLDKYVLCSWGISVEVFYSPLIEEEDDESVLYITDASIQSLVYSIQNMDYKIEPIDEDMKWKHTMCYNLYNCNFNSYKISIKNLSRLRNDKINKILNGN